MRLNQPIGSTSIWRPKNPDSGKGPDETGSHMSVITPVQLMTDRFLLYTAQITVVHAKCLNNMYFTFFGGGVGCVSCDEL